MLLGRYSRRRFLKRAASLSVSTAGAVVLAGCQTVSSAPAVSGTGLETTRLRLVRTASMCQAAQYVAEDLLHEAGFTDVAYVKKPNPTAIGPALASGEADINLHFAAPLLTQIGAGDPVVVLAGAHVGCFELFGTDRVQAIRDLKGKPVAVPALGSPPHIFLASMLAQVGLDPASDVRWETHPPPEAMQLLDEGRIDGYLGFPTDPQELRARHIGHAVIDSIIDRPWSEYFCCMVAANSEFVKRHPVATRRALRAILSAVDLTAHDPQAAVRLLVDRGYTIQYDYTLAAVHAIHTLNWRDYDAEDTLRFYGLRLYEAGMVKQDPKQLIARGADWQPLADVKRELAPSASLAFFCPLPSHSAAASPTTG
ncbi:MAG: ABC transporter substrate-binding protein [Chloroflexi bacterium]|nr:ABC transporter substrate-binding protein [Chloroflexota bacterium]